MKRTFQAWLERRYKPRVVGSRLSNCKRVEKHYGDLDVEYNVDRLTTLISVFTYSAADERAGQKNPSKMPIDGDLSNGLATLRYAVGLYREFRDGENGVSTSDHSAVFSPAAEPETERPGAECNSRGSARKRIGPVAPVDGTNPSILNGDDILLKVTAGLGIDLPRLIARSAVWVDPSVFRALRKKIPHGTWFPNCRRGKNGEPKRGVVDGVRFDDNTMANLAIKLAVLGSRDRCTRMHVCHVWPETCYDVRYHTSLANLVLLPAPLAGFSDHHQVVAECLRYRSYELFGWHPEETAAPEMPIATLLAPIGLSPSPFQRLFGPSF
jgi:hypothetical protein